MKKSVLGATTPAFPDSRAWAKNTLDFAGNGRRQRPVNCQLVN